MTALTTEAGYINYCFLQQCLNKTQPPVNTDAGDKAYRDVWHQTAKDQVCPITSTLHISYTVTHMCEFLGASLQRDACMHAYVDVIQGRLNYDGTGRSLVHTQSILCVHSF
jgi:hypothetical protein